MIVLNSFSCLTVQIWYCILHLMLTSCLRHSAAGIDEGNSFLYFVHLKSSSFYYI